MQRCLFLDDTSACRHYFIAARHSFLCTGSLLTQYYTCSTRKSKNCANPDGLCKFINRYPTEAAYQAMQSASHGYADKYSCVPSAAPTSSMDEYNDWWVPVWSSGPYHTVRCQ